MSEPKPTKMTRLLATKRASYGGEFLRFEDGTKITLDRFIATVENYKQSDCKSYAQCLDTAADWDQFHCKNCTAYEKDDAVTQDVLKFLMDQRDSSKSTDWSWNW